MHMPSYLGFRRPKKGSMGDLVANLAAGTLTGTPTHEIAQASDNILASLEPVRAFTLQCC